MNDVATLAPAAVRSPQWIVNRRFDLLWFFGGALVSLAALGVYFGLGVSILVLWWIWLLAFDGPHIAAAFTRTYVDRREWQSRPRLLLLSLLAFAVGPACVLLNVALGSDGPFLAFLALSAFYGYYHIVRQHYGFFALYKARNRDYGKLDFHLDKWCLYVGLWAPYFYFLMTHPKAREMARLSVEPPGLIESAAAWSLVGLWVASIVVYAARALRRWPARALPPQATYFFVTSVLYAAVYFLIARFEPVYAKSQGPDQDFLLLSVIITIFHNIQYLGLVWFHNRNRYGGEGDFGPARLVNRSLWTFLGACGLFSAVYLLFACWTGVFPGCQVFLDMRIGPFTGSQIGLSLWWGLAIHHYYLDQKIWRIQGDPDLRKNLGLA